MLDYENRDKSGPGVWFTAREDSFEQNTQHFRITLFACDNAANVDTVQHCIHLK